MKLVGAGDAGRRVMPPLLMQQERLVNEVEGPLLPCLAAKAPILRQRFDARRSVFFRPVARSVGEEADRFPHRLFNELPLLARSARQMHGPVGISQGERGRRQARGKTRKSGMEKPIETRWRLDIVRAVNRLRGSVGSS